MVMEPGFTTCNYAVAVRVVNGITVAQEDHVNLKTK